MREIDAGLSFLDRTRTIMGHDSERERGYCCPMATANAFAMDLPGRLRNVSLGPYRVLVTLFEAIMNSVHAIEARKDRKKPGNIEVTILRGGQRTLALEGSEAGEEISGFRITDNGVGFTETNFESFCTADSRHKLEIGGRGVGRLTWLKAFNKVRVRSTYRGEDGELWFREFTFTAADGVPPAEPRRVESTNKGAFEGTEVVLEEIKLDYQKCLPRTVRTIGNRIVDHFLVSLRPEVAKVRVYDGDEEPFDVTKEVASVLKTAARSKVVIQGETFRITHLQTDSPEERYHRIAYLGGKREVRTEYLHPHLPQVKARIDDGQGGSFWSLTVVESKLLDNNLTQDRGGFEFPDDDNTLFAGKWSLKKIRDGVLPEIKAHLDAFLAPVREKTRDIVRRYVEEQAPEYRSVVKFRPGEVESLAPDLSFAELDVELRKIAFKMETQQREEGRALLEDKVTDPAAYQKYLEEVSETARANLAKYVIHRRVILNLFRKGLQLRSDTGKYELESAVHRIIFPLRKDSDDEIRFEQANLWIIDEKLAYHAYLASDKPLRDQKKAIETDSSQRPDLIVYNRALAFVDDAAPYSSIVIVEFKRAGRNDYNDKENPFTQVYRYVNDIRAGKAKDDTGRQVAIKKDVPIFAYVVCDITPKLREMATFAQLRQTWDGQGFFGFNENLSVYVEVVSFDKVLDDAERRNRVFFEKLRLR